MTEIQVLITEIKELRKEVAELNKKFDSRIDKLTEKMKSGNVITINTPEELEKQLSLACDRILARENNK